jgi:hypothetical protein
MLLQTKDTNRVIDDSFKGKTLFLVDDKGNQWKQTDYRGDLVFDGKDFFTLLAEMNNMTCACNSELCKQLGGSDMFFNDDIKSEICIPNIVETEGWKWEM